jgi:hypothetical protein
MRGLFRTGKKTRKVVHGVRNPFSSSLRKDLDYGRGGADRGSGPAH